MLPGHHQTCLSLLFTFWWLAGPAGERQVSGGTTLSVRSMFWERKHAADQEEDCSINLWNSLNRLKHLHVAHLLCLWVHDTVSSLELERERVSFCAQNWRSYWRIVYAGCRVTMGLYDPEAYALSVWTSLAERLSSALTVRDWQVKKHFKIKALLWKKQTGMEWKANLQ